ncbi:ABC transporter substrate-binding protein [Clostridiaceae bacterium 35-E11]
MLKKKSVFKSMVVLIVALSLILTGCGGANNTSSSEDVDSQNSTKSTITKEDKNTLVVANMYDAKTVDPHAAGDSASVNVLCEITETLVDYDEEGNIIPLLAEKWEQIDDVSYKFYLRKGVKFHNGEEMKASDVVYSFKRALSPKGARVQYIMKVVDPDGFEIVDDYTVVIRTKMPFSPFVSYLPYIGAAVINEKYYEENGEEASFHPVGTGPFTFVEWKKADRVTLKRFEEYWGEKPAYENLVIRAITEANSRVIELETGGIDMAYNITANDIKRVEENPDLELKRRLSTTFTYLGFNTQKAPLDNVKLRQAIDYAIDEEGVVATVFRGVGVYTPGPVTPKQTYFDDSDTACKYDPEKAKALLKEIGMDSDLKLEIWTPDRQERIDIAQIVQSQLKEVGIDTEIKVLEWGAFIDGTTGGEHDMLIGGWGAVGFPDPDNNIYGPLHSDQIPANNYCFYSNPELDSLLDKSRVLPNGPEREKVVKDVQKLIRKEVPYVTFDNTEQIVGVRKYVKGFMPSPASSHKVNKTYIE